MSLDELAPVREEERRPCPKLRIPGVCRDIMGANRESNGDNGKLNGDWDGEWCFSGVQCRDA